MNIIPMHLYTLFFNFINKFFSSFIAFLKTTKERFCIYWNIESKKEDQEIRYENKYDELFKEKRKAFLEASINTQVNTQVNTQANLLMETTPYGLILMKYQNKKDEEGFVYYSNTRTIGFPILESVAKKYTMIFQCYSIYKDLEAEMNHIKQIDDLLKEAKRKQFVAKKNINKYIYGGTIRDFDLLNKKVYDLEQKEEMSYQDFMKTLKKDT